MDNYTLEMQASKKFYNKCSENSRSQIVFRTDILDIFRKLSLGVPVPSRFFQLNSLTLSNGGELF